MLLLNGYLMPETDLQLSLPNRGLFYNDGFFETMVWAEGRIRYLPHHATRMQRAAAALGLALPPALLAPALAGTLAPLAAAHNAPEARLRLQLWRAGAGLYAPTTSACEWLATAQPFVLNAAPVRRAAFAWQTGAHPSAFSFCKGPNAPVYVQAARERQQRGLDELVLLSPAGHVAETIAAAVAWVRAGTIYTPAEAAGGVAGVRLAHLRQAASQLAMPWQEGLYLPADLLAAEVVFTANVAGIRMIGQLEHVPFSSTEHQHPLLAHLWAAE